MTPAPWVSYIGDTKPSDGEAQALQIRAMQSIASLPLLPGPLCPGVVALDRVLFMHPIEQTECKQMTDVELWLLNHNTWNYLTVRKKKKKKKDLRLV